MKIIDAHIHIGLKSFCHKEDSDFQYDLCSSYEEIIKLMDDNGIDQSVIMPIPHRDFDTEESNNYVFEAYQAYPNRFIPFCRIDSHLEENLDNGFRGVKVHFLYEDIDPKKIKKELQLIEDANVPLVVHAKFKNKPAQIEKILQIVPNLNIILAHMGRGHIFTGEQTIDNALALKKYTNVFMDLSTVGDLKSIINVCEIIGYDRVMYASDYPFGKNVIGSKYSYKNEIEALQQNLSEEECKLIFHDNMEKLLNIKNGLFIRRVKKTDLDEILSIFKAISPEELKFLAYDHKSSLIRQIIRTERHCYVAVLNNKIVGFLRESGRPDNFSLLEEIVVHPAYRAKGIANQLFNYYHKAFHKTLAKSNAANQKIINILTKFGYKAENPDAQRIIKWKKEDK